MSDMLKTLNNIPTLVCTPDGKKLTTEQDALNLIGDALYYGAELVVIPTQRLEADFFQLKSGLAGQIMQKFITYKRQLVILGNIAHYLEQSKAFQDLVRETNRGNQVWFLNDWQQLNERLTGA